MPVADYLMFEWGDGKYFPHPDPGVWLLARAAFLPTKSVIQVVGLDVSPKEYFRSSTVVEIQVSREGMDNLGAFIHQRFRTVFPLVLLYLSRTQDPHLSCWIQAVRADFQDWITF